jgi:hypothetical protein
LIDAAPFTKEELTEETKILVEYVYSQIKSSAVQMPERSKTPFPAKEISEVPMLIKKVITDSQDRESVAEKDRVIFTTELPDFDKVLESITYAVIKRLPGSFDQGSPMKNGIRNLKPMLREEKTDPENPDYKISIFGQYFDNMIRLTCWAKTSWQAEKRALWLERKLQEYDWFLRMQGLNRFIFQGRDEDKLVEVSSNKFYGKPLNYFVRTERLHEVSTKTLERLIVKVKADTSGGL